MFIDGRHPPSSQAPEGRHVERSRHTPYAVTRSNNTTLFLRGASYTDTLPGRLVRII